MPEFFKQSPCLQGHPDNPHNSSAKASAYPNHKDIFPYIFHNAGIFRSASFYLATLVSTDGALLSIRLILAALLISIPTGHGMQ